MSMPLRIGIIGDYRPDFRPHQATQAALGHAADALQFAVTIKWLPTLTLAQDSEMQLRRFDALWCAPGSPYQSMDGALRGIRFAREQGVPFIGTCGGFQHVVLEYARNVLGFKDAAHAESDPDASTLFIVALECSLVGQTLQISLNPESRVFAMYQRTVIQKEYYCQFGLNPRYQATLHDVGASGSCLFRGHAVCAAADLDSRAATSAAARISPGRMQCPTGWHRAFGSARLITSGKLR